MRVAYATGLFGTAGLLTLGLWFGCSSSDNTNGGGSTTDGGTTHDGSGSSSGSSSGGGSGSGSGSSSGSGSGSGSSSGGDSGPTPSCADYCTAILQNCGAADGGIGGNAQYYDTADCMNTCALFAVGTYGEGANSLGCRQYHATLAASNPTVHCPHAGAGGGALCGARCDDYCSLVMAHCTTANGADPPYLTNADCLAACNAYPYQADASDYDPTLTGTLNCLDYHLRESLATGADQGIDGGHCDDLSIDGGTVRGACHP